jgi:hypothetical protein
LYSLATIFFAASGHPLHYKTADLGSFIPMIGLITIFATTLSIVDPFGNMLRFIIRFLGYRISFFGERELVFSFVQAGVIQRLPRQLERLGGERERSRFDIFRYFFYLNAKALSTNWISYEIDKVVSMLYFLIVLIAIFIALNSEAYFNNLVQILNSYSNQTSNSTAHALNATKNRISNSANSQTSNSTCKSENCKLIYENKDDVRIFVFIAIVLVAVVAFWSIRTLLKRNQIIVIYFFTQEAIFPRIKGGVVEISGKSRIENIQQDLLTEHGKIMDYIVNRDWGMAEFYTSAMVESIREIGELKGLSG